MPLSEDLCSSVLREVQRRIEDELVALRPPGPDSRLLDLGCWDGDATRRYADRLDARPSGVEIFEQPAARAAARGIEVARVDLECSPLPWPDETFDVVVANQVFEHLKNIWRPMSELHRVLKPGGALVASVPNLASLHNRILVLLGLQPTSIRTFGPHVRGFTHGEFERFVGYEGAFAIERSLGVGFYPLPARWARLPSRLWTGASHTSLLVARRRPGRDAPWTRARPEEEQTFYG
jgi:SAM-dependent methyltransferase